MTEKVSISWSYQDEHEAEISLPKGKASQDVDFDGSYIKWGELHIVFRDTTEHVVKVDQGLTKQPAEQSITQIDDTKIFAYWVNATYHTEVVPLPEGRSFDDIDLKSSYMKHGEIHFIFNDGKGHVILFNDDEDNPKYPTTFEIDAIDSCFEPQMW